MEPMQTAIARLSEQKDAWLQVSIPQRQDYLKRCMDGVIAVAEDWAMAACHAKGIDPRSSLAGEEWMVGPVATLLNLRSLLQTLAAQGTPKPKAITTRSNGQQVATVFPDTLMDQLLLLGFSGEVWLQPGAAATQGMVYRQQPAYGKLALVLGAGNISSIAATDTLHKLFAEDQVVLLKINPVNEYIGSFIEQAFKPLIDDGFFAVAYGGSEVGGYLCHHPAIDTIHITGSQHTHDAIAWGSTPTEQQQRKTTHTPLMTKPITSELGGVTSILVVPGPWSDADLTYQAHQVASMVTHNASFNCVAGKVLVTAQGWNQREEFLRRVRQELAAIPARKAYYPGAQQRYQAFLDHYPQAIALGQRTEEIVPWTVIPNVPAQPGEYALTTEAFCGVLAEVTLDAGNAKEFLAVATEFANQTMAGNLSCMLFIDPQTQKRYKAELEQAIAELRFGTIGINVWTGVMFSIAPLTWGAFPENTLENISSGQGVVHNTYLFEHPQKSVLRAPFRLPIKPLWFANHTNLQQVARCYGALLADPDWGKFFGLLIAALKG